MTGPALVRLKEHWLPTADRLAVEYWARAAVDAVEAILGLPLTWNWTGGGTDPAGYLVCRLRSPGPTFDLGARRGEVDSLVVSDAVRGNGVGSALLRACKEELRNRGVTYWSIGVVEANRDAVRLYERLGFGSWSRELLARVDD